jgi:hypothetical protein
MLRLQRTRSAARWRRQHQHLAATYRRRRETRVAALTTGDHGADADWRESRLNETYHALGANPAQAWPKTLAGFVDACDQDSAVARRWAQTLTQAGRDTDYPLLLQGDHASSKPPTTTPAPSPC